MGGPENGNFPSLYVVKMSLHRWVSGSEKFSKTNSMSVGVKTNPSFFLELSFEQKSILS